MADLFILAGVPGSGKSTWARTYLNGLSRVSSDAIRKELVGSLKEAHERNLNDEVFDLFYSRIDRNLFYRFSVVADATHLTRKSRAQLLELAKIHGADAHLILFKNLEEAIDRNNDRPEDTKVPEDVMQRMCSNYFDTLSDIENEGYKTITKVESFG